jgi:FkbM family methyltransferase
MRMLQRTVYATKRFSSSPIGRITNHAAKAAAGLCYDAFLRHYRTEGMIFTVPRDQTTLALRGKFFVDSYELPERTLAKRRMPRDATVLELGGCIGVVSCVINRLLAVPHRHVVVEANPFLIPVLERNRVANRALYRIENRVVSHEPSVRLALARNMDSSRVSEEGGTRVPTITLEELETRHSLVFDAVVMDIEGAEADFIAENAGLLRRIKFLMVEFHPDILGDDRVEWLRSTLQAAGLVKTDQMLATEVYGRRA